MKKLNKKTVLIIGAVAALIVIVVVILSRSRNNQSGQSTNDTDTMSGSSATASMIPERGFPIYKGVSKRKEVQDLQHKLIMDYGANLGSSGADGIWGNLTETAVKKYLNTNKFQTLGHLQAAYLANPPQPSSANVSSIYNIFESWFN